MCDVALLRRRVLGLAGVLLLAAASQGDPYWIAWEGDDWPENQGWTRSYGGDGDVRTLADGAMTLDGLNTGPGNSWDGYEQVRSINPGPGETFIAQWRMKVNKIEDGNWDPSIGIFSGDEWGLSLDFAIDAIRSGLEYPRPIIHFTPGVPHTYEVRSEDMRAYRLYIDSQLVRVGEFSRRNLDSLIVWGDGWTPTRSSSTWDYFRFGVLPEPSTIMVVPMLLAVMRVRHR